MSAVRYYLDNILQATEDLGWKDTRLGRKRSAQYNALFLRYASNLIFEGDAYTYLKGVQLANICSNVQFRVEYKCNEFGLYDILFEGLIKVREMGVNETLCQVRCNAEDNSLAAVLMAQTDREVDITGLLTANGSAITAAALKVLRITTPSTLVLRNGYYVFDVMNYIVKYISDNRIALVSDHFQTNQPVRTSQQIVFTSPAQLATGVGNITVQYRNYFNQTITTVLSPIGATAVITLNTLMQRIKGILGVGTDVEEEYYLNDHIRWALLSSNGVDTITLTNDFEFEILAVGGASYTIVDTIPTTSTGARKLSMLTGARLRNSTTPETVQRSYSFDEVFGEMNKFYNLGFSFSIVSGVPTMRIEPISYFILQSQSSVSLLEIAELSYKISDRFAIDKLQVGDSSRDDGFRAVVNTKNTWSTSNGCDSVKQNLKSDYITDWQKISEQALSTDDKNDEKIYVVECEDTIVPGSDAQSIKYKNITFTNTSGANIQGDVLNVFINSYSKIRNWLFSSSGDMTLQDKTIVNTTPIKLIRAYEFDHPIGYAEIKTLLYNEFDYLPFGAGIVPDKNGWIDDFESPIVGGLTKFVLLSQNQ